MKTRRTNDEYSRFAACIVRKHFGDTLDNRRTKDVEIECLARSIGVCEISYFPMDAEGFLVRTPKGLAIRVNANRKGQRQRFTVAHEIGHILLSQHEGTDIHMKWRSCDLVEEELIADAIAAEILMPSAELSEILATCLDFWKALQVIVDEYDVSYYAALRRLVSLEGFASIWIKGDSECWLSMFASYSAPIRRIVDPKSLWERQFSHHRAKASTEIDVMVRCGDSKAAKTSLPASIKYIQQRNEWWLFAFAKVDAPAKPMQLELEF